jgi:cation diffusion facilitator CzcD-associated flavoprotein CzcO
MSNNRQQPSVVIIGAGMTGMAVAIKLRQAGITRITMIEKGNSVGGTWRENRYPGVACDVPSHAYTYAFEPNPEWSSFFAGGKEIHGYFKQVFAKYKLDEITRFNEAVTSCIYENEQWTVKTSQNNSYVCDLLFSATGILHKPNYPDIKGLKEFGGICMHTARWDDHVEFKHRRIGVIGTGSTASQVIPELIKMPGTDVTVFQRTAQWIVEAPNRDYSAGDKKSFREQPSRMRRVKNISLWVFAAGTSSLVDDKFLDRITHRVFAWNSKRYLKKAIQDPVLRAKLTPNYKFGCKRTVINATFYPAIQKQNAHLVTEGIDHIEKEGVVTKDGKLHKLDILVLATGFDPAAFMRPMEFRGRNGLSIEDAWKNKITAYRSLLIPEFPNFFLMLGPNSPIGNFSVIALSEIQADYCIKLVKLWQEGKLKSIEAKPAAVIAWRGLLKSRMKHTVWTSGCNSWYLDKDGDPLSWPDKWKNWVAMMNTVNTADLV